VRILIVEDNRLAAEALVGLLLEALDGSVIQQACSVDQATRFLEESLRTGLQYDALVKDMMLPAEFGSVPELDESLCWWVKERMPMCVVAHISAYAGDDRISRHLVEVHIEPGDPSAYIVSKTNSNWAAELVDKFKRDSVRPVQSRIERAIEFSPEHCQAGLGLMNYFARVLAERHPTVRAKVRIEQEGVRIRMTIETQEGNRELIEHTLEDYGLVLMGQKLPEDLVPERLQAMALRHKLELVSMELRFQKELFIETRESQRGRVESLERQVTELQRMIGGKLMQAPKLINSVNIDGGIMGDKYKVGQAGAVGRNAEALNVSQVWNEIRNQCNLADLADDLARLRKELKARSVESEHDEEIGSVAAAEKAAREQDGPKTLSMLRGAGKWALDVAKDVGTKVAAEALKGALGMP